MVKQLKMKIAAPPERIVATDVFLMAFNADLLLKQGKHIVDLACGHKAVTKAQGKVVCPRCTEMLRRSIEDGSEDYEGFRHRGLRDMMAWPEDPCRQFNEPTDLTGNFKRGDGQ